jgi:preprotein translocase subunit Sec61beta
MSKKKREYTNMPSSSAGLMRFFQDESNGIKIPPEVVIGFAVAFIAIVMGARMFL